MFSLTSTRGIQIVFHQLMTSTKCNYANACQCKPDMKLFSISGSTYDVSCTLCSAGAYSSASGEQIVLVLSVGACLLVNILSQQNFALVFSSLRTDCFHSHTITHDDRQSLLEVGIENCVAGASLSATCSMCQAGTYWTGSGEEIFFKICFAHNKHWGHLREYFLSFEHHQ